MKTRIIVTACVLLSAGGSLSAQKNKPAPTPAPAVNESAKAFTHHRAIFEHALAYNDLGVATQATYDILALGNEYAHYQDTLALIYFQRAAWPQVIAVTSDILADRPKETAALELRAVANQTMGRIKESLEDYEALYGQTQNQFHLYEIAALQYTLRRLGECDMTLTKLIADPAISELKIQISAGQTSQAVPMPAACRNMVGVLLMDQGNKAEAKKAFEDALKIFPDFALAQANLAEAIKP